MGAVDTLQARRAAATVRDRGSELLQKGLSRFGIGSAKGDPTRGRATVTIARPAAELVELLRAPATWPRLIALADAPDVLVDADGRVRWTARAGAPLHHEGAVELRAAPHGRGTEVTFAVRVTDAPLGEPPPLTPLATHPGELLPRFLAVKAARRLKSLAETGEVPTLERNPHAPRRSRG